MIVHDGRAYPIWTMICDHCKQSIDTTQEPYIQMFRQLEIVHPTGFNSNITFPNMPAGYIEDYHLDCFENLQNVTIEEIEEAIKLTEIRVKDEAYETPFLNRVQALRSKHKLDKETIQNERQEARYLKSRTKPTL
jgi:hypothetical protein